MKEIKVSDIVTHKTRTMEVRDIKGSGKNKKAHCYSIEGNEWILVSELEKMKRDKVKSPGKMVNPKLI